MTVLRDYAAALAQPTLSLEATPTRYDEVVAPDGGLRPAWKGLASVALSLTAEELRRVDGEITRFLADDGVSYLRPDSGAEPWHLDAVPLVIDAASWARIDVGLAQRAELLNALLVDLYGAQTVLSEGIVPAAVIFGHAGFARPMARHSAADPHPLLLSGTDLGRGADGEWHVLADRVQAPSGLGFAMENRRVISQVLPDLFHEADLHRMEPYFSALRGALVSAASGTVTSPRIVVLSPGPFSETAFDQAFLSNALGFPLVQGEDLVVRDGWVWLKPAGWPATAPTERIDVIVRRVDAEWCDPLELRANSHLGVAGLAEAVRRGRVRLVNGLGAGVLENPALIPFLPAVCQHLLGEQLRLPSVPTWWCGDPDGRAHVLSRLAAADGAFTVRTIDEPRKALAGLEAGELAARIAAAPHRFVGQDLLPLSQAPVWGRSGEARSLAVVLRGFTLRYGSAYRPLVGGLATVRDAAGGSPTTKDVWVLKAAASDPDQGLPEILSLPTAHTIPALAPRALEDLFWAGRYAERAEDLLRLLLTAQQQLDQPYSISAGHRAGPESVRLLRRALSRLAGPPLTDPEEDFRSLLLDTQRRGSAAHCLAQLRAALEGVRDQLSGDTWRVFSGIERAARSLRSSTRSHRTAESGGRMLTSILSLHGVTSNMIRDAGWHMIEAGRYLERALQVCHLLSAAAAERSRAEREDLTALLTASESIVTHRRRYRGSMRTADVLDLLLLDRDNPRSVAFALHRLRDHLAAMPSSTGSTRPERLLEQLEANVAQIDPAVLAVAAGTQRPLLITFLKGTVAGLEQLGDAIAQVHFESGPPPVPMSSLSLVERREVPA